MNRMFGCFVCLIFLLCNCNLISTEKQLLGGWKMHKVYEGVEDVSLEHNPAKDRWIYFKHDGTFESGGSPFGINSGKWSMDESKQILFIDSRLNNDDSAWNVSLEKEQMIWTGIGDVRKEQFKLIHKRK